MFKTNQATRNLRSVLLLGAASAAAIGFSMPAYAQDQGNVETVVVTGSRIPQQGIYSATPVTAVGSEELKMEGTTNVENLLNNLPEAEAEFGSAESNGSTGTASVNLRNLGSNRTLVLIDGKRLMPGAPDFPVPDLNQIPAILVDHVEVLTGGASAVYGSDAVAGVVNFIMRKDFEGIELDGQYSINQHDNTNSTARDIIAEGLGGVQPGTIKQAPGSVLDGQTGQATILIGANSPNDKGNVTLYAGYQNTQAVLESDRDVSACGLATTFSGSFICAGSSTSALNGAGGRFISLDGGNCDTTGSCTIDGNTGQVRGFTNADRFNFAPFNYFQRPDERYTMGAMGHYQVNKQLDVYSSLMFMDDHTVAQIAPSGAFFGTVLGVNCANPFLGSGPGSPEDAFCTSAGLTPADEATLIIGRRLVEAGPRQDDLRHTSYRMVFGARGDLGDGWSYDAFAQYGTTVYQEEYLNDVSLKNFQNALNVVSVGGVPTCESVLNGTDTTCVPINIFQPGGVSQAAARYVAVPGMKEGATQEWVVGGTLTGDLGAYGIQSPWAKNPVAISLGTEYRQEALNLRTDFEFSSGDLAGQGGPTPSVKGQYNVSEGYTEVRIPVIQGMPFVEDLSLHGGYRYSSYSNAGSTNTWEAIAEWQPIDDFRIRAGDQRAVRAPNVNELFTPQALGLFNGQDPCSGPNPALSLSQCENTHVTAAEYGHIIPCPAGQCNSLFGGNANLRPETADTKNLGIVFTPTFFDGFTSTIDYFRIEVGKAIGVIPQGTTLEQCAITGDPTFCDLIVRGPQGILFGTGAVATTGHVVATNVNTGLLDTRGMDFEANYTTDFERFGWAGIGGIALNFLGTWTQVYLNEPYPGAHEYDCAGLFGLTCLTPQPSWRHRLRATWTSPWDFDFSINWRHLSSVQFDANTGDPTLRAACTGDPNTACDDLSDARIKAYDYFDLATSWTIRSGVQLHAGVNNIFDKDPPLVEANALGIAGAPFGNGNTYPQVYDALGRFIFVGATIKY